MLNKKNKNMMLRKCVPLWLLLGGIFFFSCNQDPIFYAISQEVKPVPPRINGMPTNIVQIGSNVYVASRFSGTISQYNNGNWTDLPEQPGGKIIELTATAADLYALSGEPGSLQIKKKNSASDSWETISGGGNIQSIYGAGDYVFAGVMTSGSSFEIFSTTNGAPLQPLSGTGKFLTGAAYDGTDYYLATAGDGIFTSDGTSITAVSASEGFNMTGIIALDNQIVGVSRDGKIVYGTRAEGFTVGSPGPTFTGALGFYKKDDVELLLLGIQGSDTTHGYREIEVAAGKLINNMTIRVPGADPARSSVANADKYNSSLRRHPVVGFLQAPDSILFAATTKNGLWSYRERNGEYAWNAED